MPPFEEEGVYCFADVGRSVRPSVRIPNGFRMITWERVGLGSWNFIGELIMTCRWPLLIWGSVGQRSSSQGLVAVKQFPDDNLRMRWPRIMKLHRKVDHDCQMTPNNFEVSRSRVTGIWRSKTVLFSQQWGAFRVLRTLVYIKFHSVCCWLYLDWLNIAI